MPRKMQKEAADEGLDFKKDMRINEHELDMEWLRQPGLHAKWASLLADADFAAKKAHERVKIVRSELILSAARGEVSDLGAKPTGPVIEAFYRTHPDHVEAKETLAEAEHTRDLMFSAVQGIRMRKDAVENLTRLYLAGYYSSPHADGERPEQTDATNDPEGKLAAKLERKGK